MSQPEPGVMTAVSAQALAFSPFATTEERATASGLGQIRLTFLQLQSLIAIVLSYQLLFSPQTLIATQAQLPVILGLMLSCAFIMALPDHWMRAPWFPGAMALTDTAVVTGLIYLSGNLNSDLYLAYFVIILIATMAHRRSHAFMFFGLVCLLYGFVLYRDFWKTGIVLEHHLLRMPLLLVMAVFYNHTVHTARALTEFDALTRLPNRRKFVSIVDETIARVSRTHENVAVFFLNLDGFKLINETLGRHVGDQLLKSVAMRLTEGPGKGHIVAREGGDEFTILIDPVPSPQACAALAEEVIRSLEPPFALANREIFVSTSLGIALYPRDAYSAEELLEKAEAAMSMAKEQGQNTHQFYFADINAESYQRLLMAQSLRKALYKNELQVFYQPQIELATGKVAGVEALVRWGHPEFGLVPPKHFIGTAEETGLIVPIGHWMIQEACRQVSSWQRNGQAPVRLSVNLSARQLGQLDLASLIREVVERTGFDPAYMEVELTESLLLQDTEAAAEVLHSLKELGIRIAIDDFGTGYSSLSYLKRYPIDTLKIDQTFIRDVTTNPDSLAIVRAIMGMAQALRLKVIAEGVETEEQIAILREEGCHECQGFAFSEPLPGEEIARFLQSWTGHGLSPTTTGPQPINAARPAAM